MFHNDTELPAMYEVIPQDEISQFSAVYEVEEPEGVVDGYSTKTVKIFFLGKRLGSMNLPVYFRIKV